MIHNEENRGETATKNYSQQQKSDILFDGGWAWIISLSCFVIFFVYSIHDQVLATLAHDVIEVLDTSESILSASYVVGICSYCLSTIFSANFLLQHFPRRSMGTCAAIINGSATIVFVLRPNVKVLFAISFLKNLTKGITLVASLTLLCNYFRRRTALALSMALMGSSVCLIVVPTLARYLREVYGFRGCFLIIAGLEFQAIYVSMLLRPISSYTKQERKPISQDECPESGPLLCASTDAHCLLTDSTQDETEQNTVDLAATVKYLENGLHDSCRESPLNTENLFTVASIDRETKNVNRVTSPAVKEEIIFLQNNVGLVESVFYLKYDRKNKEKRLEQNLKNVHGSVLNETECISEKPSVDTTSEASVSCQNKKPIYDVLEETVKLEVSNKNIVAGNTECVHGIDNNGNCIVNGFRVEVDNDINKSKKQTINTSFVPNPSLWNSLHSNFEIKNVPSLELIEKSSEIFLQNQSTIGNECLRVDNRNETCNSNEKLVPVDTIKLIETTDTKICNSIQRPMLHKPQEANTFSSKIYEEKSSNRFSVFKEASDHTIHSKKDKSRTYLKSEPNVCHLEKRTRNLTLERVVNTSSAITPVSDRVDISMTRSNHGNWFSVDSLGTLHDASPDTDPKAPIHSPNSLHFWRCFCLELLVDFHLLKNQVCVLLIIIYCTVNIGVLNVTCLQTYANFVGTSPHEADILTIVFGAMDIAGRIFSGVFADLKLVKPNKIIAAGMLSVGIFSQFAWLFTSFNSVLIFASVLGLLASVGRNLAIFYILEVIGLEQLAKVLALCTLFLGLYLAAHSQIQNVFREYTGSCLSTFHYIGIIDILASLLLLSEPVLRRWLLAKENQKQRKN